MPLTPSPRARRLRTALTGGAVPLLLLTALPVQAQAQETATHTIRPGDTLSGISAARGVPVVDLLRLNDLARDSVIYAGDVLRLSGAAAPAATATAGTYRVQPNDGWWIIARRTCVSAAELQRLNGMNASTLLHPGMVLATGGPAAATPEPSPTPAPAPGATYTVQPNDGWWIIARRTCVSAAELQRLNGMNASTLLHPGMVLATGGPAAATPKPSPAPAPAPAPSAGETVRYTVVRGDSQWSISQRFDISIPRLRELNGLTRSSQLHPGQVLVISDGTVEVEPVSAVQPIGDTFLGYTYPKHVTASANQNYALLLSVPQPTPEQMQQIIRETAERMGVDPRLALGHAYTESRFRMASVSPANAVGAMQVIPTTGEFASDLVGRELNLLNPYDNAVAGVAFIKYIQDRTPTLDQGIAAYYQGLGGVLQNGVSSQGRDYVAKVRAAMAMV